MTELDPETLAFAHPVSETARRRPAPPDRLTTEETPLPDTTVRNDPDGGRYVATVDGEEAGSAHYLVRDGTVVLTHTEVDPKWEGKGVGSALARATLDDLVAGGREFVPRCPFIASYVERHPEYAEHVAH